MSFWSELKYVRTGPPPEIHTVDIADFLNQLAEIEFLDNDCSPSLSVKYGSLPELAAELQEKQSTYDDLWEIEWDDESKFSTIKQLTKELKKKKKAIRQCHIGLGLVTDSIFEATKRDPCEENEVALCLDNVSFSVGPSLCRNLESDPFNAGWIDIKMSGNGYYFPWPYREAISRADAHPEVVKMKALCRSTWPVQPNPISKKQIALRREMGELWVHESLDLPDDWYWFASES